MAIHNEKMTYSFEIDNFSQRNTVFATPIFSTGSCNWYVYVYPKGDEFSKNMCLWLTVPDPFLRPLYWSRETFFRFVVVNPSNVNSSRSFINTGHVFNKGLPTCGFRTDLSLSELQEGKFLVNDKLKIEVYIGTIYAHGGLDPDVLPEKKKETVCVNGFQVLDSQVKSAKWIFETYPETALYIQPQDPQLKTAYMNILLRIYETLYNSPLEKLTENELSNVSKGLLDLTQAGFKLEWLREKLEKVSVERKKLSGYEAQALELGKQLKNLELMMCNLKAEIKLKAES
ncbi:TRAF-like family protein [Raphanus sativus]|uniref:MATH domain and coiled-coil domain-containing protein At2g42465-like n=1 Tax=Raphanus sativus TaxID=3726 RepID=A0A9W3D3T2_RAPSA|nr:MATH domain and coiled-coil domain-containing protein At2g42465-like [Raphanus sativus]KAJ4865771.1 TRAF-like family protein [Raphanus sativus]